MIELKHVSFTYQGQKGDGLQDINLTIEDGECVLFCGRSGCGKTTITRLVNGLIPQFYAGELAGSVLVDGTSAELHIENLRNRNIFELSGGEKQKIAFASVYAMNPQIYLLDEPSSNLDMRSIQELGEHLRLIKSQGKTILIAEHRLYYLMDLVDRIVYLEPSSD